MANYEAFLTWRRGDQPFVDGKYSRAHEIRFDGGHVMPASSSPQVVRPPLSDDRAVDPEEMLVAALSSCHALFFLDFARRAGFVVDDYSDRAAGVLGKDERGKIALTKITLSPEVTWGGHKRPSASDIAELHHQSHEACYIAHSFRGEVVIGGH